MKYDVTLQGGSKVVIDGPPNATNEQLASIYNSRIERQTQADTDNLVGRTESAVDDMARVAEETAQSREASVGDYLEEIPKGLISGAASTFESAALGLAAIAPKGFEDDILRPAILAAGQSLQDYVTADYNQGGTLADSGIRQLSEAGGSFAAIAGTSLLNPYAGGVLAVSQGAGGQRERARAEDATREQMNEATVGGGFVGALELLPINFIKAFGKQGAQEILGYVKRIVVQSGVEAGQEAVSEILNNAIAKGVYKPEQELLEGAGKSAMLGGGVGGIVQTIIEIVTPRRRAPTLPTPTDPLQITDQRDPLQITDQRPPPDPLQITREMSGDATAGLLTDQRPPLPPNDTANQLTQRMGLPGVAGLLPSPTRDASRSGSEVRAAIGKLLDEEGAVPYEVAKDLAAKTGITQKEFNRVVNEEMSKRGGALAARAETEILDEQTDPDYDATLSPRMDRQPQPKVRQDDDYEKRRAAAISNARGGRGTEATDANIAVNEQAAQAAARDRQGIAALGVSIGGGLTPDGQQTNVVDLAPQDPEGLEQPDLFALQQEQEKRRVQPTEAPVNREALNPNNTDTPEVAARKAEALASLGEPQTLDMLGPKDVRPVNAETDLVDRIDRDEAQEASANVRKAAQRELQKQEDIDVDTELGLREMQAEVTETSDRSFEEEQLSFRGMLRQGVRKPNARNDAGNDAGAGGTSNAGAGPVSTDAGGTPPVESTPPAGPSNLGNVGPDSGGPSKPSSGTKSKYSSLKDPKGKKDKGATVNWLNTLDAVIGDTAQKQTAAERKAEATAIQKYAGKLTNLAKRIALANGITPPKGKNNFMSNLDLADKLRELAANPVVPQGRKTNSKREADSNTKKVLPALVPKKPNAKVYAPKRVVVESKPQESAEKTKVVGELATRWADAATEKQKRNFNPNHNVAGLDNPFSLNDNRLILNLLNLQPSSRKGIASKQARQYLGMFPMPQEGLYEAIFDVVNVAPKEKVLLAPQQTVTWAMKNFSDRGKKWVADTTKDITKSLNGTVFKASNMTIQQLAADGAVDPVQQGRDKAAREAQEALDQTHTDYDNSNQKDLDQTVEETDVEAREVIDTALLVDAVVGLDVPTSNRVVRAIKNGDLKAALQALASTSPSKHIIGLASKFAELTGTTKLVVKKNLKTKDGRPAAGLFDPETNTITLDEDTGINTHTLMHEMTHAAGSASLDNPSNAFAIKAKQLFASVKDSLDTAYGAQNVQEFFAEAMGNQEFRIQLNTLHLDGETITVGQRLRNLVQNFLHKLVPSFIPAASPTALQQIDSLVDGLLAPAPRYRNSGEMAMQNTPAALSAYIKNTIGATQKSLRKGSRKAFGAAAADFWRNGITRSAQRLLLRSTGLSGFAEIAESAGFGKLGFELDKIITFQRGAIEQSTENTRLAIESIFAKLNSGVNPVQAAKREAILNDIIYSTDYGATIYQVDPNGPRSDYITKKGEAKYDNDGNNLLEVYDELQKVWRSKEFGAGGRAAYKELQKLYSDQYDKLRKTVMGQIDGLVADKKDAERLKNKVFAKLMDRSKLKVYFPLMREGKYILRYTNIHPKSKRLSSVLRTFETEAERKEVADYISSQTKDYKDVILEEVDFTAGQFGRNGLDMQFASETIKILDSARTPSGEKIPADAKDQIMQLFVNAFPETSFARSLQKRKGTPGYMTDSMLAARTKGYTLATQTAKLEYGARLRNFKSGILAMKATDLNDLATGKTRSGKILRATEDMLRSRYEDIKAEMVDRADFARQGSKNAKYEGVVRRLNQGAFIYTIGFNASSALVNMSQIPLFVAPYLGGKYDDGISYTKTYAAIKDAYGIVLMGSRRGGKFNSIRSYYNFTRDGVVTLKTDLDFSMLPPEEAKAKLTRLKDMEALVSMASKRGLLSPSFLAESLSLDEYSRAKTGKGVAAAAGRVLDNISVLSAVLFNQGEQINRQVTLIASFNLALDAQKGKKDVDAAVDEAINDTQKTNGGTFLETAPSIAREGIGRVALMYKNYGLQMYLTMLQTAKVAFDGDKGQLFGKTGSPERRAAWKQLIGIHATAMIFAGVQGLPLYGAVRLITNMFLDDDEDDMDTIVRKYIGEGWYKGAITEFSGLDVAGRVALTGLLVQTNRFNTDPSVEETLLFYMGGPALSVGKRLIRGVNDLNEGNVELGIESMIPAGLANMWKAGPLGRYTRDDGIYTRRRDPIYTDTSFFEDVGMFIGLSPTPVTFRKEQQSQLKLIDITVNQNRSKLSKEFYLQKRMNDWVGLQETIKKMRAFSKKHPEAAIDAEYLKKSQRRHAQTSVEMRQFNGISVSPTYLQAIKMLQGEYKPNLNP